MGKIWLIMLISSLSTLMFINPQAAIASMLQGSNAAINLAMTLVATYGFWLGFFAILEKTGVSDVVAKILKPIINFLFKGSSEEAKKYISMNMSANLLGLGNAATPMGIKSVQLLSADEQIANKHVKMLIVISSTSLQLLPSTVISMRISHGSNFPTSFLLACTVATVLSTIIGISLCKIIEKLKEKKQAKLKKASFCHKIPDLH